MKESVDNSMSMLLLDYILFCCIFVSRVSANLPMNAVLQNDLLNNDLRRTVLPDNGTGHIKVWVSVSIEKIRELDDVKEELHWVGFVSVWWTNPFLSWDPDKYGGTTRIFLQEDDMWTPDICIYERLDAEIGFKAQRRRLIKVHHSGGIEWTLGGDVIVTRCNLHVTKFPFDKQKCSFRIGSYVMARDSIELLNAGSSAYRGTGGNNSIWTVIGWNTSIRNIVYGEENLTFQTLKFSIWLERKSTYFIQLILAPSMVMSMLIGTVFLMPIECGEKLCFSITLLLALNVLQLVTNDQMPKTSETVPIINIYVVSLSLLCALTIPLTIFVNTLYYRGGQKLPSCVRKMLVQMATPSRSNRKSKVYTIEPLETMNNNFDAFAFRRESVIQPSREEVDWKHVARKLDTFLLKLVYVIIILVTVGCGIAFTVPDQMF